MSATISEDATAASANQPGEFGSHVPRTGPETTTGHQPGKLVGNEAIRESHIQTLPAGTAPAEHTYHPQTTQSSVPGQGDNPHATDPETGGQGATSASDTLVGATSAQVHTGLGHPGQGQTSKELHHDGAGKREHQGQGLQGVGASGAGHHDETGSSGKRVP